MLGLVAGVPVKPERATYMPGENTPELNGAVIVAYVPVKSNVICVAVPGVAEFRADTGSRQSCAPVPVHPFVHPSVRFQSVAKSAYRPVGSIVVNPF